MSLCLITEQTVMYIKCTFCRGEVGWGTIKLVFDFSFVVTLTKFHDNKQKDKVPVINDCKFP